MKKWKRLFAILLATTLLFTLVACGSNNANDAGNNSNDGNGSSNIAEDGTISSLRVGIMDALGSLLSGSTSGTNYVGTYLVYDKLFDVEPGTKEVTSDVLEDWYYEDDTTLVLKVKDGIYFSNGEKMTGEDVFFSIYGQLEYSTSATLKMVFDFDNSYVKDDGMTVVLKMKSVFGPVYSILGSPIYCMSWAREVGWDSQEWCTNPVGSGPYKVKEYKTDAYIILERREDYWDDLTPYPAKEITIKYYAEAATAFIDLETGGLDLALAISENDYARGLNGVDNVAVAAISSGDDMFFSMDDKNTYLSDPAVRQALAYGVDWVAVGEAGYGAVYQQPTSIFPASNPYYVNTGAFEYNPEKAKQILADAGYEDGEIKLHFLCMEDQYQKDMAETLLYYVNQLGMEMDLEFGDISTCLAGWQAEGGSDFSFQKISTGVPTGDPFGFLSPLMNNHGTWAVITVEDEQFNTLATNGTYSIDPAVRTENYQALQQYVHETCLVIPITEIVDCVGYRTDLIEGVNFNSGRSADLGLIDFVGN